MITVEQVNYGDIIRKISLIESDEEKYSILGEELSKLASPKHTVGVFYFWMAIWNASLENDEVWRWLREQPYINRFDQSNRDHTSGRQVRRWILPSRHDSLDGCMAKLGNFSEAEISARKKKK